MKNKLEIETKKFNINILFIIETCFFLLLLLLGVTGSAINEASLSAPVREKTPLIYIEKQAYLNQFHIDEWQVTTPNAISQYYSNPRFEPVNKNYGLNGKNMGIVHDVGAPVKSLYTIAKPATWGFFFFDLKRALSWYWLIPIYLCLNGMWLLLNIFFPKQEKINFVLALATTFAPSFTVWGFWPSYQLAFGTLGLSAFIKMLESVKNRNTVIYSILFGLCFSCLVLTLYVPRIVPILTFTLFIGIAYICHNHLWKELGRKIPYLMISLVIFLSLVGSWYIECKTALEAVLNSSYPGARKVTGGDFAIFDILRGFLMPFSIYCDSLIKNDRNFYERIDAFNISIFLFLYSLFFLRNLGKNIYYYVLFIFIVFVMVYQYIGFPSWLADSTLWSRTLSKRVGFIIDIAIIFIIALFYYINKDKKSLSTTLACIFSLFTVAVFVFILKQYSFSEYINLANNKFYLTSLILYSIFLLDFLLMKNFKYFIYCYFIISFLISLNFNNFTIAPIKIVSTLPKVALAKQENDKYNGRLMFCTNRGSDSNLTVALGLPVFNPTYHYIDKYTLNALYNNNQKFNRFHHMNCHFNPNVSEIEFNLIAEDSVLWEINPHKYDFDKLPIDRLIVKKTEIKPKNNPSLKYLTETDSYWIYNIVHKK